MGNSVTPNIWIMSDYLVSRNISQFSEVSNQVFWARLVMELQGKNWKFLAVKELVKEVAVGV